MKVIRSRAPLRLGLAGGGTDLSPYCDEYGGFVLNATIDKYAYCLINCGSEKLINFSASDLNETQIFNLNDSIVLDYPLILHKAVYLYMIENYNNNKKIPINLQTFCDVPMGSGLGASSTLVVAMITAFQKYFGLDFDEYKIADLAFKIERIYCKLLGGKQDQYAAAFGGINFMEFYKNNNVIINPLRIKDWIQYELEACLVLCFSGTSRISSEIVAEQISSVEKHNDQKIKSLHKIKEGALMMKEALLKGNFDAIVESMKSGWESKKDSASKISNNHLNLIYEKAINAGALSGKISGAGGGGFFMFFVNPENRTNLITELQKLNLTVTNFHITNSGSKAWSV